MASVSINVPFCGCELRSNERMVFHECPLWDFNDADARVRPIFKDWAIHVETIVLRPYGNVVPAPTRVPSTRL